MARPIRELAPVRCIPGRAPLRGQSRRDVRLSTVPKPCFAAKSNYCLVRKVVAPWFGPSAQLQSPWDMPQRMTTDFIGLNELTSPRLFGMVEIELEMALAGPDAPSTMRIVSRRGVWRQIADHPGRPSMQMKAWRGTGGLHRA